MKLKILLLLPLLLLLAAPLQADTAVYSAWVDQMKVQPRGPFSRIRWFCHDGTVLPPKAYACRPHGGGVQHGQWNAQTVELRDQGYLVASLLAGIQPGLALEDADFENTYGQRLVERFLIAVDDGWILRQALFYRGAIQEEDERAGGRALLQEMLSRKDWTGVHFLATRSGVKLLPHGEDSASAGRVRQQSASLSEDDPPFMPVRIKIHGAPDASDAARVRAYLESVQDTGLQRRYSELAQEIDRIYQAAPLEHQLAKMATTTWVPARLRQQFKSSGSAWASAGPSQRMVLSAALLAASRDYLGAITEAAKRLELLDFSLRLETEHFRAATAVREQLPGMSRAEILQVLAAAGDAAYGVGLLNKRLQNALRDEVDGLSNAAVNIADYQQALSYLNRVPGWGLQAMRRYFYRPMVQLAEIEPMALLFIQDQLRGSPLMFYSQSLNLLVRDAGRLAGIRHKVFGQDVGAGFTALNPGLARGVLQAKPALENTESLRENGIYVLPETIAELPPVAGILTAGEGNPLSHVQLLARNLGIPNVTISPALQQTLREYDGSDIVLAVSPGGLVEISEDKPRWDAIFANNDNGGGVTIIPDLDKLDLSLQRVVSIDDLSADDSGRTVGPKAAKLAELRKHYPEAVSRGVAIPFGAFKAIALDQAYPGGGTLFAWMQGVYRTLEALPVDSEQLRQDAERFRAELYQRILDTRLDDAFKADLKQALTREFGGAQVGLFVRSDTNVEDLAGFTGAGLNLTLPNVVDFEALLDSITRVWASPFTARAFSWRQFHMSAPEHVYTSILLLESVGSDKSGVLVTADIDTGATDTLSVAVNEGLGGAVDGQAAESLRIPMDGGPVRVLATATAPWKRNLSATGGISRVPASGSDTVLSAGEIDQLRAFARTLTVRFPPITDDKGSAAPADIEFGFLDGQLRLFQLRPFLDSASVGRNSYLQKMDTRSGSDLTRRVDMSQRPQP
ncbi:MAG: PEP/pyruvate-binding domain-containing protein [Halioglobus sp.]